MAAELYALTPAEFTVERNKRAKAARADGDAELAQRVARFPKPSAAAWAVNMLVRHRSDLIDEVLELGASLREAQQGLDSGELRELSQARQQLLAAVTAEGSALAEELGQGVSESAAGQLGQTLQAAMADTDAAAAVLSGALVSALSSTGFDPVDVSRAVAIPVESTGAAPVAAGKWKSAPTTPSRLSKKERAAAKRSAEDAEGCLRRARVNLHAGDDRIRNLACEREQFIATLAELRNDVRRAEEAISGLEREAETVKREQSQARHAVEEAERQAERARRKFDDFNG